MPKVLIADDSMAVRKVAERLLKQAGLEVALAASGEEALAWLANERPDLIISDVIMPGRSGYDVCKFVRSQENLIGTPVLLISGIVNDEVKKQVVLCQADGVLKKPFQGSSLQDKVKELLEKRPQAAPAAQAAAPPAAEAPAESAFKFTEPAAAPPSVEPEPAPAAAVASPTPETVAAASQPPFVTSGAFAAASASAPAASAQTSGPKVYRITEDKLHAFRQAVVRVKELEAALVEEQAQSAKLVEQLAEIEQQLTALKAGARS